MSLTRLPCPTFKYFFYKTSQKQNIFAHCDTVSLNKTKLAINLLFLSPILILLSSLLLPFLRS